MNNREDELSRISNFYAQDIFLALIHFQEILLDSQKDIFNFIDQTEKKFLFIQNKYLSYYQQLDQLHEERIRILEKIDLLFETVGSSGLQDFNLDQMKRLEGFKEEVRKNKKREKKLQIEFKAMLKMLIECNEIEAQNNTISLKIMLDNQEKIKKMIQDITRKNSQFCQAIQYRQRQSQAGPQILEKVFLNSLSFLMGDFTSHLSTVPQEIYLIEPVGAILKSTQALFERHVNFHKNIEPLEQGTERTVKLLIDMEVKLVKIVKDSMTQCQKIRMKMDELFVKAEKANQEDLNPLQTKQLEWYEDEMVLYEKHNQGPESVEIKKIFHGLFFKLNEKNMTLKKQFIDFWIEADAQLNQFIQEIWEVEWEILGQSDRRYKASSSVQETASIAQVPTVTVSPTQIGIFSNTPQNSMPHNTSMPAPNLSTTNSNFSNSG